MLLHILCLVIGRGTGFEETVAVGILDGDEVGDPY